MCKLVAFCLNILCFISFSQMQAALLDIEVQAESAILVNADTGAILFEKNAHAVQYPASITKIATALYTLHVYSEKLSDSVAAEHDAVASVSKEAKKRSNYSLPAHWLEPGATHIGIKRGETLSLNDLLNGMMISSGNDASNVIAQYISGSVPNYMEDLNVYLKNIGTVNTHFCNPHGLHHPKHVTTAYDMAIISREAMRIPAFRQIVKTIRYTRPKTNKQSPTTLIQTNRLLRKGKLYYDKAVGIKTGWTSDALNTFVAAAEYNGRTLIAVLLRAKERESIFKDAKMMFEAAFNQPLVQRVLLKAGPQRYTMHHPDASKKIQTYLDKDVCVDFYPAEEPTLKCTLKWLPVDLPVIKDQHVGNMLITKSDGQLLQSVPLFAQEGVSKSWVGMLKSTFSSKKTHKNSSNTIDVSKSSTPWKMISLVVAFAFLLTVLYCMRCSNR